MLLVYVLHSFDVKFLPWQPISEFSEFFLISVIYTISIDYFMHQWPEL